MLETVLVVAILVHLDPVIEAELAGLMVEINGSAITATKKIFTEALRIARGYNRYMVILKRRATLNLRRRTRAPRALIEVEIAGGLRELDRYLSRRHRCG